MAKLRTIRSATAHTASSSDKPVGPLSHSEARKTAREHPVVRAAEQRVHEHLRMLGVAHPEDPRSLLTWNLAGDPVYAKLSGTHSRLEDRVREMLKAGTTEAALAAVK